MSHAARPRPEAPSPSAVEAERPEPTARLSRDYFSALIKDSQSPWGGFLAERERWLRSVQVEGREELLFEFEMLLRGVERYFNLHNLPIDTESRPVVVRDFHDELLDVRDALNEAIRIARRLLDPDSDQKMVFRRYIESQLADDRVRRVLIESELDQDTPQESLFVLRQSFESLRSVIDHLLKLEVCGFGLYTEVGNLALREIVLNRYFRPFRPLEFRIEYDRVKSLPILEALRELPAGDRRLFTVAFLALFRILHYLSYVGGDEKMPAEPRARVILALVRSEAVTLVGYLRGDLASKSSHKRHRKAALEAADQLSLELDRIAGELLSDSDADAAAAFDAAVAMTRHVRHHIVALARSADPKLAADFDRLVSRVDMAERLRLDLNVFSELARAAEAALKGTDARAATAALGHLRAYVGYFQDVSYQLLRYGDYESFDRFIAIVLESDALPQGPTARERMAEDCRIFGEVTETMCAAVGRRAELAHRKLDKAKAAALLDRFTGP